jgi:hypothetical protein
MIARWPPEIARAASVNATEITGCPTAPFGSRVPAAASSASSRFFDAVRNAFHFGVHAGQD